MDGFGDKCGACCGECYADGDCIANCCGERAEACFGCTGKIDGGDEFCRSCGIQFLDDEDADSVLTNLIDNHAERCWRPALHARLRRLVAGEKA